MNALSLPLSNRLFAVIAPRAAHPLLLDLSARLAAQSPLRVLDGGNQFNVYPVARALRRQTTRLTEALARITLARAFTCYQVEALLAQTPAEPLPTLVLDVLSTFYDENVRPAEGRRLFNICLNHLSRLSACAPVVVSARPPGAEFADRLPLLASLRSRAAEVWEFEEPVEVDEQLLAFGN
jgi:hypothetical protein